MEAAPPIGEDPAVDPLASALDDLHHRQGRPSYRAIGRAIGCSHTTVSRVFHANDRPSWELVRLIVGYLDGDEAHFRRLWYSVGPTATDTDPTQRTSPFHGTAWVIGACFIITTIALGAGSLRPSAQIWISDISQIGWGLAACVALMYRTMGERGRSRIVVALCLVGIASWSIGHIVWTVQRDLIGTEVPSPGPADIGYYLLPLFTAAALAVYGGDQAQALLRWVPSCAVVACAVWTLLTIVVAASHHGAVELGLAGVVAIGYPVTDAVIAWWALHVARNSLTGFWTMVAMAFTALALSDTAFVLVSETDMNSVPPGADLGFIAAPMLLLAAAVTGQSPLPTVDSDSQTWRAATRDRVAAVAGVAVCAGALAYTFAVEDVGRAVTGSALVTAALAIGVLTMEVRKA